jgi:hypothetical protein
MVTCPVMRLSTLHSCSIQLFQAVNRLLSHNCGPIRSRRVRDHNRRRKGPALVSSSRINSGCIKIIIIGYIQTNNLFAVQMLAKLGRETTFMRLSHYKDNIRPGDLLGRKRLLGVVAQPDRVGFYIRPRRKNLFGGRAS